MDKNAIKKYAVWARNELITRVTQKAEQYEITKDKTTSAEADSIGGRVLSDTEKKQRQALIAKIDKDGFESVMEEVAYTWFNRFTALRFMEVNNYLPSHTRVFTNEEGEFKPQILADAIQLDIEGLNMDKVYELKDANKSEELYKYLLITQCNALSSILPRMFQKIADYTELLLPDYLLRENSAIEQMISVIPEEDWHEQVEIIGWLYQYYIAEPKDVLINARKQYGKKDIPFVTQIFTSDWIVRYMVENSLGRFWTGYRTEAASLREKWSFYLSSNEESNIDKSLIYNLEDLRFIDPCSGSGHILCYAFDVFVQLYEADGYTAKEAVKCIVSNNLWGIDLDERAAQMAYFSIMMKARQYDRRFFATGIQPHVFVIKESNDVDSSIVEYYVSGNNEIKKNIDLIIRDFRDAKIYGSLIRPDKIDFDILYDRFNEIREEISIFSEGVLSQLLPIVEVANALAQKYDVIVTNPPYMNASYMPPVLKEYVIKNYSDFKSDLFSCFANRVIEMTKKDGHVGLLMPYVWMFISSYENMRRWIYANGSITSLIQLEYNAFEAACVPVAALTFKKAVSSAKGEYVKLSEFKGAENQAPKVLEAIENPNCGYRYSSDQNNFLKVPGAPVAYWVSDGFISAFEYPQLGTVADAKKGISTSDNDRFLRYWFEVDFDNIGIGYSNSDDFEKTKKKWVPLNKGGVFRKWFGNNDYVINWKNNGSEIKGFKLACVRNERFYFGESLTWTDLTSYKPSFRYNPCGFIHDVAGPCVFSLKDKAYYLMGLLNSVVTEKIFEVTSPTMHFNIGTTSEVPVKFDPEYKEEIDHLVKENIEISKEDWDSFETSWDFSCHPLVDGSNTIEKAFNNWSECCNERFVRLKSNEERLNEIFIAIYGLENDMNKDVEDKDVTVSLPDVQREIKSLISYAVGCMFGRYSLDKLGDAFLQDEDNIIPICDDEYFNDDIVVRFIEFISLAYGKENIEENLQFVAKALGGKGSSRDVIRQYFINGFYSDHIKTFQKTPIYWLFDSGKKNGFKCLIYVHRYAQDTVARIRTDYVHEQQSRYRTAISDLQQRINGSGTGERVKLDKQLKKVIEQSEEIQKYEEKIHHLADQMIAIDLDDGVKHNYEIFKDVLAKIK